MTDENALDMMLLDDDALQFPLPTDDHTLSMMLTENNTPFYNPHFSQQMDDDTFIDLLPIDDNSLFLRPPPQLPQSLDVIPVVGDLPGGQPFQHPVADAAALRIPPWLASTQTFNPALPPSSPPQDGPCSVWDQVSSVDYLYGCLSPSPLPLPAGILDLPGLPATQTSALVLGVSAVNPPAGTHLSLNVLGSPQPPMQEGNGIHTRTSVGCKRPLDQPQPSTRPEKRLATIRPRLPPSQPSSAGGILTMTTNPPPKSNAKQANVPAKMVTTFQLEVSRVSNLRDRRTRSTKVCLKCRTLRQKVSLFRCEDNEFLD